MDVRSITQLATSAYLTSAVGCVSIIHKVVPPRLRDITYQALEDKPPGVERGTWHLPSAYSEHLQTEAWNAPQVAASFKHYSGSQQERSRSMAADLRLVSYLGLRMENNVFCVAAGLCLGDVECPCFVCTLVYYLLHTHKAIEPIVVPTKT